MNNNLSFDYFFPFIFEKNYKKLSLLNNKRIAQNNKENNIQNLKDIDKNSFKKKKIFNINKDFSKLKFYINSNFIQINPKINYHDKCYNNLFKIENCNRIFINKSNIKQNKLNNSIIIEDINDDINKNINGNIFSDEKDINLNKINNLNHLILVKSNNKMVYMNKTLIKQNIIKKDIIFEKKKKK